MPRLVRAAGSYTTLHTTRNPELHSSPYLAPLPPPNLWFSSGRLPHRAMPLTREAASRLSLGRATPLCWGSRVAVSPLSLGSPTSRLSSGSTTSHLSPGSPALPPLVGEPCLARLSGGSHFAPTKREGRPHDGGELREKMGPREERREERAKEVAGDHQWMGRSKDKVHAEVEERIIVPNDNTNRG